MFNPAVDKVKICDFINKCGKSLYKFIKVSKNNFAPKLSF